MPARELPRHKIVFGTDVGAFPHGTGAREFRYMVEYGMSPLETVRTCQRRFVAESPKLQAFLERRAAADATRSAREGAA